MSKKKTSSPVITNVVSCMPGQVPPPSKKEEPALTRVVFLIDDSASICSSGLQSAVVKCANEQIAATKKSAYDTKMPTRASIYKFASRLDNVSPETDVQALPLVHYGAAGLTFGGGSTWLFGAIDLLLTKVLDQAVPTLLVVLTDGLDNATMPGDRRVAIDRMKANSFLTTVFLGPPSIKRVLLDFGVEEGNIRTWETAADLENASQETSAGLSSYYKKRTQGVVRTASFFLDANQQALDSLPGCTSSFRRTPADKDVEEIAPLVERKTKRPYVVGSAYYLLGKNEDIQKEKQVVARHKKTGKIIEGPKVREALGLPSDKTARVKPGNLGDYEIFVQSTSLNRKIYKGDYLLIDRRMEA